MIFLHLVFSIFLTHFYTHCHEHANEKTVKVALFGDQGHSENSVKVLKMIDSWGANLGDFDYDDNPDVFEKLLNDNLSPKVPVFAALGNHEVKIWKGYQAVLNKRLKSTQAYKKCKGEAGYQMSCNYKGIFVLISAVGTYGNQTDHEDYLEQSFQQLSSEKKQPVWKICAWHKTQQAFQIGEKPDETGYKVYDLCRENGAMIFNGHKHAYSRTSVFSNFEEKTIYSTGPNVVIGKGHSFSVVSGTGGYEITDWLDVRTRDPWWEAYAASNNGLKFGAVLCTFNTGKEMTKTAECEYRDINGKTWDKFNIEYKDDSNNLLFQ